MRVFIRSMSADLKTSLRMGSLAAVFWGTWAALANLPHGGQSALYALGVQAAMSFSVSFALTEAMHAMERGLGTSSMARLATACVPTLIADVAIVAAHLGARTPEILRTIAPNAFVGFAYSCLYVMQRSRLSSG